MNPAFKQQIETMHSLVTGYNLDRVTQANWQLNVQLKTLIGVALQVFTVYVDENPDIWSNEAKFKHYNLMYNHIKILKRIPLNEKSFNIIEHSVLELNKLYQRIL